ncbi:MAG: hypothetical protein KIT31_42625, partial [Deltaproteobacteria bacterium]|nr:hypothetical protein [Deltaproteobacteria bacterium]
GREQKQVAWIQVTRLGLTARADGFKLRAWLHDLTPGKQLAPQAAEVQILVPGAAAAPAVAADATGLATVDLPASAPRDKPALVVARSATDSTFAVVDGLERTIRVENARWFVSDDRFTYKPGETVYVKGWVRWTDNGINPDLALPAPGSTLDWELHDARRNKVAGGTAAMSDHGGFDLQVALPANINLGTAMFTLRTRHEELRHAISVLEFRTPAYSVALDDDVQHAGARPLVVGESLEMNATARYYAGGGLDGASIRWAATLAPAAFRPPGWDLYTFAPPRRRSARWDDAPRPLEVSLDATVGAGSSAALQLDLAALPLNRPSVLTVDATVADLDRMHIRASSRAILVHPSERYAGVRMKPGTDPVLELVATDVDGKLVGGVPITVEIEGVLGSERHRDGAKVVDTQACGVTSRADGPVTCAYVHKDPNTAYVARVTVADARGRKNVAQYAIPWWAPADPKADLAIVPDKASYRPGDVAKLELRSSVVPATAVVTFARQGVIAQRRLELASASTVVELPIEAAYLQNVFVVVDRWGKRREQHAASAVPLPEHTQASVELAVDLESARLAMTARPRQPLVEPGAQATFDVEVARDGAPVAGAEVALMVVDEAVLALSARKHGDPLPAFYRRVAHGTDAASTLSLVDDAGPRLAGAPGFATHELTGLDDAMSYGGLSGYGSGGGGAGLGGRAGYKPATVEARKDFRPNAVFAPRLVTDARGRVSATVKMPDNLTRYRIVAFAAANVRHFGVAEGAIVVQRKLNARTVAPRFLSQGDRFSLPVIVQNLDAAPRTVDVAVRAANLVAAGPQGARITIPGGQRGEVRFDFATAARGKAAIQTIVRFASSSAPGVTAGELTDASTVTLPVYAPATTESFATYGTVEDKPAFEQLAVPGDVFPDVGGFEVELASTQLQALTDAYWYLQDYPFECAEQRSARMLATTAVADLLDAFEAPGRLSKAELAARRTRDVAALAEAQRPDGGWGYFAAMASDPLVTMQVHEALVAASAPAKVTNASRGYLMKLADGSLGKLAAQAALPVARRM